MLDPTMVFKDPKDVVANIEIIGYQKIEIPRRWKFDAGLGGISYVRKPQAERLDPFGESYPIRGTHIPSQ